MVVQLVFFWYFFHSICSDPRAGPTVPGGDDMHTRFTFSLALLAFLLLPATSVHAAPVWSGAVGEATIAPGAGGAAPEHLSDALWQRVEGCARSIAAGGPDQVVVAGCDGSGAAGSIFTWKTSGQLGGGAARFVPQEGSSMAFRIPESGSRKRETPAAASWLSIGGARQNAFTYDGGWIYAIGPDARLYRRLSDPSHDDRRDSEQGPWNWEHFTGSQDLYGTLRATAIASGWNDNRLWMISTEPGGPGGNRIYSAQTCEKTADYQSGFCWREAGGAAVKIAVGTDVWVVSLDGGIFRRDGGAWTRIDGCARDIAANGEHLYVVGCDWNNGEGTVYKRFNNQWVSTRQRAKTLAVDAAGTPWLVNAAGHIFNRKAP